MLLQDHSLRKNGFTLVELAIVLVIIGLLIGGILVARSMAETTKITAQINQISQFDAAVANFIATYKYPPGDATAMGCNTAQCNDGNINDTFTGTFPGYPTSEYRVWYFDREVGNFWIHLSRFAPVEKGVTYNATVPATGLTNNTPSRNVPQATIDKKAGIVAGSIRMQPGYNSFSIYVIGDYSTVTSATYRLADYSSIITPAQALAIDKKIDDGTPHGTGNGGVYPAVAPTSYWGGHDTTGCANGTVYRTTDTVSCALAIRIMHGSGGMPGRMTDW